MILDTTVLVDLQRELRRDQPGPVSTLLQDLGDKEVAILRHRHGAGGGL